MKKQYFLAYLLFCFVLLQACEASTENTESQDNVKTEKLSFDQRKDRHITGSLAIDATEKYTTEVFREKINNDDIEDAIITVNRLNFAKNKSLKLKNAAQIAEMGYMGEYNYFIFYDGKLDKFSVPVPIPSSPLSKLQVKFENLSSEKFKDLTIEYRVLNAAFRNYYTIYGDVLQEIFQVKIFDHIGESKPEYYFTEYDRGSISDVKNIIVYEGKIENFQEKISDIYSYEPVITKTNRLYKRWFYNPKIMKYMSEDPSLIK